MSPSSNPTIMDRTLTLLTILFSAVGTAHAYPGATAQELETSVQVKSVCHTVDASQTDHAWYGYETSGVKPDGQNKCPKGYRIALLSSPRRVKDREALEASASMGYKDFDSTSNQYRYWTTDYSVNLYENDQRRVQYLISEAKFDGELKSLLTASETTPVLFKTNYVSRKIEPSVRIGFAKYEKVIKVIGTCTFEVPGSIGLIVRPVVQCGESQFRISADDSGHTAQTDWHSQIIVYSQFGMKLFTSSLLRAARKQVEIDLRTASPEHPVLVTIDTKNNQVLKIEPSISPYTL